MKKIAVIGTGYVGLVTGTCFAEMGNHVICVDLDEKKVKKMQSGICPIYEPGLEALMKASIDEKRLSFTTSYQDLSEAQIFFMAVGTPPKDNGEADLRFLYQACDQLAGIMKAHSIIVLKSTVPVGTGHLVDAYLKTKTREPFSVINNPEFLKEGSAVQDFLKPERIIIGASDSTAAKVIEELYEPFNRQVKRTIHMSNLSAELTKYAANCFLATKISFINEMATLCEAFGADIDEVRTGIASDSRIGSQFLYPGPGYGGSCFPKDVKALIQSAAKVDYDLKIVKAAEAVNSAQKKVIAHKVMRHFKNDLRGKTVTLWGVAFKANTDDVRETPAIDTVELLHAAGAKIHFYDPEAGDNFQKLMHLRDIPVDQFDNKYDALNASDALVVLTEWKQFRSPDFEEIAQRLRHKVIFDGRNLYNPHKVFDLGFSYHAIGKRSKP
jgi:UDPglucose 6-dehydrogenase